MLNDVVAAAFNPVKMRHEVLAEWSAFVHVEFSSDPKRGTSDETLVNSRRGCLSSDASIRMVGSWGERQVFGKWGSEVRWHS